MIFMNEIKCPKCGTVFQIDEDDYVSILKQVKDQEFEKELKVREEKQKAHEESLMKDMEKKMGDMIHAKELEIKDLNNKLELKKAETDLAIKTAVTEKEKEIDLLQNELQLKEKEHELEEKKLQEGFLEKTHTSSGRVPSSKGYKYYCEYLRDKTVDDSLKYSFFHM